MSGGLLRRSGGPRASLHQLQPGEPGFRLEMSEPAGRLLAWGGPWPGVAPHLSPLQGCLRTSTLTSSAQRGPAQSMACRPSWHRDGVEGSCGHPPTQLSEKAPALLFQPPGWGSGMATLAPATGASSLCPARCAVAGPRPSDLAGPPNGLSLQLDFLEARPQHPHVQQPSATLESLSARGALRAERGPLSPSQGPALQLGLCNLTL